MSLATKYRPQCFEDVCGQKSIITILQKQISSDNPSNCYLFTGSSGVGKTTLARIFAYKLNNSNNIMEIDGASNNGVDNIRNIINISNQRSITNKYNIILIDECHMITTAGWNAFLKCLEEPAKHTIFILCTTDPQKIPNTILNRVMRFDLSRVNTSEISSRLKYICKQENYTNYEETCDYIAQTSYGGMRDAISTLEKCASLSTDITLDNAMTVMKYVPYKVMFKLTNAILDKDAATIINTIDDLYNNSYDLNLFVNEYVDFLLDINKYCIFKNIKYTKLPISMLTDLQYIVDTNDENCTKYFNRLMTKTLDLANLIKGDKFYKNTITINFLSYCK